MPETNFIAVPLTIERLQEIHNRFWEKENAARDRRILNPQIVALANEEQLEDVRRLIPIKFQKSPEQYLADAERRLDDQESMRVQMASELRPKLREELIPEIRSSLARAGGRARKPNRLQQLFVEAIRVKQVNWKQALDLLVKRGDVLVDLKDGADGEKCIHFLDKNGFRKSASVSGVRYRFARAKKIVAQAG
jgi:hypothetical protein